jgi:DNA-binding response OmpR family regulator
MAETILVVEDEGSIQEIVSLYLKRAGFLVLAVSDGAAAIQSLEKATPDLVVLDLMLPKVDGFEITRWLRSRGEVPIIMLTARREEADRIAGLEMGADDYLVKPFSPQELVSRVRAVLRRVHTAANDASKDMERALVYSDLTIDPRTRSVLVNGQPRELTSKEFDLLCLLAGHPRQVFSRNQLLDKVWGVSEYIDPGTVTVHMRRIREKIEQDPANPHHLTTVWGVGYRFEP